MAKGLLGVRQLPPSTCTCNLLFWAVHTRNACTLSHVDRSSAQLRAALLRALTPPRPRPPRPRRTPQTQPPLTLPRFVIQLLLPQSRQVLQANLQVLGGATEERCARAPLVMNGRSFSTVARLNVSRCLPSPILASGRRPRPAGRGGACPTRRSPPALRPAARTRAPLANLRPDPLAGPGSCRGVERSLALAYDETPTGEPGGGEGPSKPHARQDQVPANKDPAAGTAPVAAAAAGAAAGGCGRSTMARARQRRAAAAAAAAFEELGDEHLAAGLGIVTGAAFWRRLAQGVEVLCVDAARGAVMAHSALGCPGVATLLGNLIETEDDGDVTMERVGASTRGRAHRGGQQRGGGGPRAGGAWAALWGGGRGLASSCCAWLPLLVSLVALPSQRWPCSTPRSL